MKSFMSRNQDPQIQLSALWNGAEDRLIPLMRIVLALSSQLIILTHPEDSLHGSMILTSFLLGAFAVYSIWVFIRTRSEDQLAITLKEWAHWVDAGFCIALIAISRGASSSVIFPGDGK